MMAPAALTTSDILAAASQLLLTHGYSRVPERDRSDWKAQDVRMFEDSFSIVAVAVYDNWQALLESWLHTQAVFVELISKVITGSDPKAWEAYLVLLTPGSSAHGQQSEADIIRYDTNRTRKLVAGGEELKTLADVSRALLPLLPLDDTRVELNVSVVNRLPELLERKGVPRDAVEVIVRAFLDQEPLVDKLHSHRSEQ